MWHTLYRSFAGDKPEDGYFPTVARFGAMTPDDMFPGARLAAAEAINAGTTYVHSWCHNMRSAAHAEADIRAIAEIGIRARHSCGWPQGMPDTQMADQAPIETLPKDWKSCSNEGLITLGMAWRGKFRAGRSRRKSIGPSSISRRPRGCPSRCISRTAKGGRPDRAAAKAKLMGQDISSSTGSQQAPRKFRWSRRRGRGVGVARQRAAHRLRLSADQRDERQGSAGWISVDTTALAGSSTVCVLKFARDPRTPRPRASSR